MIEASNSFYNCAKFPLGDLGCNLPRHAFPFLTQVSTTPLLSGAFQTCTDHQISSRCFPRCTRLRHLRSSPCETPRPFNCLWPFRRRGSLASTRKEAQQLPLHTFWLSRRPRGPFLIPTKYQVAKMVCKLDHFCCPTHEISTLHCGPIGRWEAPCKLSWAPSASLYA